MDNESSSLRNEFLSDHRRLTQGLARIQQALQANNLALARRVAHEVDRLAGPHVEFEEQVLYPELARVFGRHFVQQLHHEHEVGKQALRALVTQGEADLLDSSERAEILREVGAAMEHAFSCGTLLSHVDALEPADQARMLAQLDEIRTRGRRWTNLPATPTPESSP
jgi:hypothetical protein